MTRLILAIYQPILTEYTSAGLNQFFNISPKDAEVHRIQKTFSQRNLLLSECKQAAKDLTKLPVKHHSVY